MRGVLGKDVPAELMQGADWQNTARQAVADDIARTKAEGTDRWADLLKATMPEDVVRDAILTSPAWPDIAAAAGVDHRAP
ncbi:hypothetical protein [Streptomyces sp. NPDC059761]|uniref:hypothetical protein n=1 Tax=Streptomyces sp. NPDC059761 TaxID=3346937 RepID=UPI00364E4422